ncbi:galactokinase [Kibdelosporangium persicum]|uniref:Galactokinase n=1 Tax=Kibdelosporangium persicum TaxID=2698649 RepID=A0ABX2FAJ8_9PSEU|nr:galactokinase [Kibdelosporangium persicum]NRN68411.1 Galactokinase [Kibdelosporangium persicum]
MNQAARAAEAFERLHGRSPAGVWSAPGRVNLIGEHTDYNDGFVLPFAIPYRTAVAASPRTDDTITVSTLHDRGRAESAEPARISELAPGTVSGWSAYPYGVAWVLRQQGISAGADLVIAGDVPAGAGLSSSHSLECATALALLGLASSPQSTSDIAKWIQQVENDFVGAPTGLLDQTASLTCTEAHVLFLDVRSGEAEQVPFDASRHGLEVLVIDTRANHSHTESGYGARRRGCEQAAEILGIPALRDISPDTLDEALGKLPEDLRPLVKHVVTENDRVLRTVDLLRQDKYAEIGPLLSASHASLRDDYRVSCDELDVAAEAAEAAGALGARMIGGGFGGSAIALVRGDARAAVEAAVTEAFAKRSFTAPRMFTGVPSAGAGQDL